MKRFMPVVLCVCLLILAGVLFTPAANIPIESIMNNIFDSTNNNISVAITDSTTGLVVSEETALTNTVNGTITSTHTTSGTPAANIGNGYWVYQETSASNTEKVMELNAVITDATAASEDAKFSVELMAAGAAATEKFAVSSIGDISASGGLTFDGIYVNPYEEIDAAAYSITSADKAQNFVVNYTDTGAAAVVLGATAAVDGRVITIKDGELNANSNNIVVGGGGNTIDEAATYTLDADGESVTFLSDGTNWFIIDAYLE